MTGITQADISRFENGTGNPSLRTLKRLAKGLGMNIKIKFGAKMARAWIKSARIYFGWSRQNLIKLHNFAGLFLIFAIFCRVLFGILNLPQHSGHCFHVHPILQGQGAADRILCVEKLEQQGFHFPLQQSGKLLLTLFRLVHSIR